MQRSLAVLFVVLSVGLVGGVTAAPVSGDEVATIIDDPPPLGLDTCAVESPADFADPATDVLGWHDGYWYDEPIDIDRQDGLTDADLDAVVARTSARIEALRCLPFDAPVPIEIIDRETYRSEYAGAKLTAEHRRFENARALALFMVGTDQDAVAAEAANHGETVGGFFDIETGEIVLVSDTETGVSVDEAVLAHELVHALQAQHVGLEEVADEPTDTTNAYLGLVEGEASFIDTVYEGHCSAGAWAGECLMPPDPADEPDIEHMGLYLLSIQPYADGASFVRERYAAGGWAAVDEVHDDHPTTAAAVMVPDRYPAFEPAHPPRTDHSSDAWTILEGPHGQQADHLGEVAWFASLVAPGLEGPSPASVINPAALFEEPAGGGVDPLDPYNFSHPATDGWVGDRFVAYAEADADEPALAYTADVRFSDVEEAAAFADAWADQLAVVGATAVDAGVATHEISGTGAFDGAYHLDRRGTTVSIVYAPRAADLRAVDTRLAEASTPSRGGARVVIGVSIVAIAVILGALAWRYRR